MRRESSYLTSPKGRHAPPAAPPAAPPVDALPSAAQVLLLDVPTNHLDYYTTTVLLYCYYTATTILLNVLTQVLLLDEPTNHLD